MKNHDVVNDVFFHPHLRPTYPIYGGQTKGVSSAGGGGRNSEPLSVQTKLTDIIGTNKKRTTDNSELALRDAFRAF